MRNTTASTIPRQSTTLFKRLGIKPKEKYLFLELVPGRSKKASVASRFHDSW